MDWSESLGFAIDLGPPPADADQEESPVAEKFGRLAFEGVADKLENPADHEESECVEPEAMEEKAGNEDCDREQDGRDAEGVAEAIDRILVAGRVLRDPLLAGAIAKHAEKIIHRAEKLCPAGQLPAACTPQHAPSELFDSGHPL
jgi:hypothetical protein